MPNRVYITFIEGIEFTPEAVRTNVREAWMLMVIYKSHFPQNKISGREKHK